MKKTILIVVFMLSACSSDEDIPMDKQYRNAKTIKVSDDSRINVERISVFSDNLAYQGRRGIYIITDKKTGKEYIGISGVGISETAVHSAGKAAALEER